MITVGHSAGGHLALWAAARHRLANDSPLFVEHPQRVRAAVNLAGVGNLQDFPAELQKKVCGDVPIAKLLGGAPEQVPQRLHDGSPSELLPLGVPQVLITGTLDWLVPLLYGQEYQALARKRGDKAEMTVIEGAGHFELIAPGVAAWPIVQKAVLSLVKPAGARQSRRP